MFLCLKYEIELMLAGGTGGAIVNMSSTAGEQGVAGLSAYVASKFGVAATADLAAAALWLCSGQSSFITGTVLAVDGGRLAGTPAFHTRT